MTMRPTRSTRPAAMMLASAGALVALDVVLRLAGAAEHTSILSGMPKSDASYVLGPLYVLVSLAAVSLAPILTIASVLDLAVAVVGSRSWRRRGVASRRDSLEATRNPL